MIYLIKTIFTNPKLLKLINNCHIIFLQEDLVLITCHMGGQNIGCLY